MAVVSYPGVYVEEVSSGVRPIAAASTSTPAFVGLAEMGPDNIARRVTSWTEFQRHYGTFLNPIDGYLAYSVFQFFNNGGSLCYIVRITRSDAVTANVTVENRAPTTPANGVIFSAKNKGVWGNYLFLQIEDGSQDAGNTFKISIRRQTVVDVVPEDFLNIAPLEVHDNLSMDPDSPRFVESILRNSSDFINATVDAANEHLQAGIHRGGIIQPPAPPALPTLELGENRNFQINVDDDGFQIVELSAAIAGAGTSLADIAAEIQTAVRALPRLKTSTDINAFTGFTCTVESDSDFNSRFVLQSGTNSNTDLTNNTDEDSSVRIQNASTNNAAILLRLGAGNDGISQGAFAVRRPATANTVQIGDAAVESPVTIEPTLGSDGTAALNDLDYSAGFSLLDEKTDFSLLAVPGVGTEVMTDLGMSYCSNRSLQDVFYIGDMTQNHDEVDDAEGYRNNLTQPNSYGAVFFPWIQALDPSGRSEEPILLPPSGYIAGLFARIDSRRGVWKAAAGTEATLSGAVGLAVNLTDVQQGILNPKNVNCIRRFSTVGIVSWGARTITSDPEWTYVPVRRMAIMMRVSIYYGIQWAVFEPNDEELWSQLRLNITSFMMTLYRKGAFQGSMPSQAFFVKCDSETTTQADIDLGIVNVLVGFAPLKPAEFVVVKISQKAGQNA